MEEEKKSKVYILIDDESRVTRIDGGYSIDNVDVDTWIYIDEGTGDKYSLCQTHYLDKPLMTDDFIYQYKYVDGEVEERTEEEMDADRKEKEDPSSAITMEERINDLEIALCEIMDSMSE